MKQNKRRASGAFLLFGMMFLGLGLATNNTIFSWVAVACILISLILGGRWMRPRKR